MELGRDGDTRGICVFLGGRCSFDQGHRGGLFEKIFEQFERDVRS